MALYNPIFFPFVILKEIITKYAISLKIVFIELFNGKKTFNNNVDGPGLTLKHACIIVYIQMHQLKYRTIERQ